MPCVAIATQTAISSSGDDHGVLAEFRDDPQPLPSEEVDRQQMHR